MQPAASFLAAHYGFPMLTQLHVLLCSWTQWQKPPNPTTIPALLANPSLCAGVSAGRE